MGPGARVSSFLSRATHLRGRSSRRWHSSRSASAPISVEAPPPHRVLSVGTLRHRDRRIGAAIATQPPWGQPRSYSRRPAGLVARGVGRALVRTMDGTAPTGQRQPFRGRSTAELEAWLAAGGIDIGLYGTGPAKTTAQLLEEVELGESVLSTVDSRCCRVVSVLNVFIRNDAGQVLMEEKQVRPNGEVRKRGLPLSEKLKGGEAWRPAVDRAIREELGSILAESSKIEVLEDTYTRAVEVKTSASYPGLSSEYHCHRVQARVEGLPDAQRFTSTEPRPNGTLTNHWIWQSAPS